MWERDTAHQANSQKKKTKAAHSRFHAPHNSVEEVVCRGDEEMSLGTHEL